MGKQPQMTRQGTRYEPYKNSSRRRASPPPDSWGIHAGSSDAQLNGSIFELLEDLNTRFGSRDLREVFRDHINQPGPLAQAIETWIQYDEIRGPRQQELTDFQLTLQGFPPQQHSKDPEAPTTEAVGIWEDTRAEENVTGSPPVSLLRLMRGVDAPPLFSVQPPEPSAVHGSSNRLESPANGHDEQGRMSRRNSDESAHETFWEAAGWTPEDNYQGFREEGYRIPSYLKGKGRARLHGPNEGGETPEEQDSSRWSPPRPGDPLYATFYFESRVSSLGGESVSPGTPINAEPQDEDSIMMAAHEEARQEEHEQPQPEPQPEPQPDPQPRRSARIKAKNKSQDAVPPKVKTPAKSTSRKRAVRKK